MANAALSRLQHHVSGAIARGEGVAVVEQPATNTVNLSQEQASLLVWLIEQTPKSITKRLSPERELELFNLYETLHLFADKK